MSSKPRAERRREAREQKKLKRLSENTVIRYHKLMGFNFQQSRKSLEHRKPE